MQDTGEMVPPGATLTREMEIGARKELQAKEDNAVAHEIGDYGVYLRVGEEVLVKGGRFVVHSIGRRMICLRGLPGTLKP